MICEFWWKRLVRSLQLSAFILRPWNDLHMKRPILSFKICRIFNSWSRFHYSPLLFDKLLTSHHTLSLSYIPIRSFSLYPNSSMSTITLSHTVCLCLYYPHLLFIVTTHTLFSFATLAYTNNFFAANIGPSTQFYSLSLFPYLNLSCTHKHTLSLSLFLMSLWTKTKPHPDADLRPLQRPALPCRPVSAATGAGAGRREKASWRSTQEMESVARLAGWSYTQLLKEKKKNFLGAQWSKFLFLLQQMFGGPATQRTG